jgi:hypothetical protein
MRILKWLKPKVNIDDQTQIQHEHISQQVRDINEIVKDLQKKTADERRRDGLGRSSCNR